MNGQASASTCSTSVSQISGSSPGATPRAEPNDSEAGELSQPAGAHLGLAGKGPPLGRLDRFGPAAVDCEAAGPAKERDTGRWWRQTRIHVALLGLTIAVVNCYAQVTFCIAIVEMVLPADYPLEQAARFGEPSANASALPKVVGAGSSGPEDRSCPIEFQYRDYYDNWRFPERPAAGSLAAGQQVDISNRFNWDASQQGLLLGASAFGTAPLQIVGGRLAETYGSKWVLLAGCIGTALTNLTIPCIAHFSFLLLLVNRILMGAAQAGMEPGLMCLLADWLTPQEAGFFISMLLFAICVGFFLGSLCSSLILGLGYGWPLAYYASGGLNLAVGLVWYFYADSWPHASRHIGQRELEHIAREQGRQKARLNQGPNVSSSSSSSSSAAGAAVLASAGPPDGTGATGERSDPIDAPWLSILATRSVWAFIVCKVSVRWCADVMANELPTYLANVLHLSIKINGLFNSVSAALFMVSSFLTGWLVDGIFAIQKDGGHCAPMSARRKTLIRKMFQSVASFGSAICIVLMTQYDCDILVSLSMLLILSCCLVMGTGGELQIPYDMTSRYPGTLHGMACTLSVSGWLAPPLIGLILGNQPSSRHRWSIVWYSTAAITLIGGLAFVLFADSSPRDFDGKRKNRTKSKAGHGHGPARDRCERSAASLPACDHDKPLAYVNGALNSSSCESSPKSHHENYLSHHQSQYQEEAAAQSTGAQAGSRQDVEGGQGALDQLEARVARNKGESPFNPLKLDLDRFASGRPTGGLENRLPPRANDKLISSICGAGRKTIAGTLSSSALIEDQQHGSTPSSGVAPAAAAARTMIDDASEASAEPIVHTSDKRATAAATAATAATAAAAAAAAANATIPTNGDLNSNRALSVSPKPKARLSERVHNAAAHYDNKMDNGQQPPSATIGSLNEVVDGRTITHL